MSFKTSSEVVWDRDTHIQDAAVEYLLQGTCHWEVDAHLLERAKAERSGFGDGGRVAVVADKRITDMDCRENMKWDEVVIGVQGLIVVEESEAAAGMIEKVAAKKAVSLLVAAGSVEKGLKKVNEGCMVLDTRKKNQISFACL